MATEVLTHRGLEPARENFYSESTHEAFADQLRRGFGIEFDLSFTRDGVVVVHDLTLERITGGRDKRLFRDLTNEETLGAKLGKGRLGTFGEIMKLIQDSPSKINALHLKGKFQEKKYLDILLEHLESCRDLFGRILIFDVKPETARYIKTQNKRLLLAPSVAHWHDIQRYNQAVSGTLISIKEAVRRKDLYEWVWLDEWDRKAKGGKSKKFYTKRNFGILRKVGYKIALVTPELHASSPGILGGERHSDAIDREALFKRIEEILNLEPDAVCTDYPDSVIGSLR